MTNLTELNRAILNDRENTFIYHTDIQRQYICMRLLSNLHTPKATAQDPTSLLHIGDV